MNNISEQYIQYVFQKKHDEGFKFTSSLMNSSVGVDIIHNPTKKFVKETLKEWFPHHTLYVTIIRPDSPTAHEVASNFLTTNFTILLSTKEGTVYRFPFEDFLDPDPVPVPEYVDPRTNTIPLDPRLAKDSDALEELRNTEDKHFYDNFPGVNEETKLEVLPKKTNFANWFSEWINKIFK